MMPFLSVVYVSEESDGERERWQRLPGGGKHIIRVKTQYLRQCTKEASALRLGPFGVSLHLN